MQRPCGRNGLPVFRYKSADLCIWSEVSEGGVKLEVGKFTFPKVNWSIHSDSQEEHLPVFSSFSASEAHGPTRPLE